MLALFNGRALDEWRIPQRALDLAEFQRSAYVCCACVWACSNLFHRDRVCVCVCVDWRTLTHARVDRYLFNLRAMPDPDIPLSQSIGGKYVREVAQLWATGIFCFVFWNNWNKRWHHVNAVIIWKFVILLLGIERNSMPLLFNHNVQVLRIWILIISENVEYSGESQYIVVRNGTYVETE